MTQAYALKGMRSPGDFRTTQHQNNEEGTNHRASILAHKTLSHIYPEGEVQVEFVEKTGAYWLIAELPDIQQDDVTIQVDGQTLMLHCEWPEAGAVDDQAQFVRPYRAFARQFELDEPVEAEAISMTYTDGVLAVCVPKLAPSHEEPLTHLLVES